MKVFYGSAIQGAKSREERANVNRFMIESIKENGFDVVTEHTTGTSYEEAIKHLEKAIGPLPEDDYERRVYVRNKMIEGVEGEIEAAVFEVSVPSLGTGVEVSHAYLRPRLGLKEIPVLALYLSVYQPVFLLYPCNHPFRFQLVHFLISCLYWFYQFSNTFYLTPFFHKTFPGLRGCSRF